VSYPVQMHRIAIASHPQFAVVASFHTNSSPTCRSSARASFWSVSMKTNCCVPLQISVRLCGRISDAQTRPCMTRYENAHCNRKLLSAVENYLYCDGELTPLQREIASTAMEN